MFQSMIQFCTCNKRLVSSPEIAEGEESSKSCRSCGGIFSEGKLCDLSARMWSSVGPEFSGVIDPQLKWNKSSNGKHRALRRARTFTQYDGKKFSAKSTEDIVDLFDEASKKEGDMLVSESEKFGVSVLGRRFSDNLESVPIKKRRFSLLPPQPTPHILSSSAFHGHNHGGCLASLQNSQGSLKQDVSDIYSSHGVDLGQEKSSADEKRCLEDIDEHTGDSADFSGISILAAAACYSSIEKGFMEAKGPTAKGYPFEENPSSLRFSESAEGKDQPSKLELGNNPKSSVESFTSGEALGCKEENSVGSLQNFSSKRKSVSVSVRDDRLHWDLNTVMDVWESQPDEFSNSDPLDSYVKSHGSQLGKDEAVFGINKIGLIAADNQDISHCSEEIDRKHACPVADCDQGKCGLPETKVCEPLLEECQFKDAPEKTSPTGGGEKSCVVTRNAHLIEDITQLDSDLSAKLVDVSDEEKHETDNVTFRVEVDTRNTLPSPVSTGNAALGRTMNACDSFSENKNVKEMLHDDSTPIAGECRPACVEKGNLQRSPLTEKHQPVSADASIIITAQRSSAGQLDQSTSGFVIHGDEKTSQVSLDGSCSKSMSAHGCLPDETNSQGTSDNEQLPSRNARIDRYKETSADLKADDCKSCILRDESLIASTVVPFHSSPEHADSISEGFMMERNDIPLVDNISISPEERRTPADAHVRRSVKDSFEEHLDSEHYSDACPIGADSATGLEKFEFLGDDDSQYEDGELRESVLNSWGEDGVEEVETEHVDYGSDCRESESESESDFCSDGTTECKHEGKLVSTFSDGSRLRVAEDDSPSECFQTQFSIKDASNANYAEGDARKNPGVSVASELPARDESRLLASNIPGDECDVPGKSSQPDSSRMKSSGWDKLPRTEDAPVDPLWNNDTATSARRMAVSSVKRDSSSRTERLKSSEASCRKEASYAAENKKLDRFDLNAEWNANTSSSIGRSKLPFRSHGRGRRVDCWAGSPDHRGNCRFDASGHYSSPKLAPPGSRNAAAAAVAKAESNGFVVAPDGTIVKAASMGPGSHLSARSLSSSTHLQPTRRGSTMDGDGAFDMSSEPSNSAREVSPDRCFNVGSGRAGRHGSRFISLGHRNLYHAPILDRRMYSPSLQQHPSSGSQRSFSPQRRPGQTRSPSRSKTRSPHAWTSPRGREMNGDPGARRQSRSPPNFKTQRRMPRQRSPPRRAMPPHSPSPRSHSSPPHASRWFDDERVPQGNLREHQPRCPTGRSSPARVFSQSHRLDLVDSRGRLRPDEYYQPIYSARFREHAGGGYGRGSKHDGRDDDRRGKSNRYEWLGYGENGIRESGFQRRESPRRTFGRSIDARGRDSPPRRIKGDMFHFRRDRDGKPNAEFKPFEGRDTAGDMAFQRRPS